MKKRLAAISAVGLFCAAVAGCGGGGDDSYVSPTSPRTTAEGFWYGTLTSTAAASNGGSDNYAMIVLENGDTWAWENYNGLITAMTFGPITYNGNQFFGSLWAMAFQTDGGTATGSAISTGSFFPMSSLDMQLSIGPSNSYVTYTSNYDPTYDQSPALLSIMAGNYSGQAGSAVGWTAVNSSLATISSSGAITISVSQDCSSSGTIQPRATGKDIYDVALSFQGSTCDLGLSNSATVQGVAFYASTGLIILAANTDQTDGFIYSATSQATQTTDSVRASTSTFQPSNSPFRSLGSAQLGSGPGVLH